MLVEGSEISGAAADISEEVGQSHQRIDWVRLRCRRLHQQRHNGAKTWLGVYGRVAVPMAVVDLIESCSDGFGIKPVPFQMA